jgi:serine protease AprX
MGISTDPDLDAARDSALSIPDTVDRRTFDRRTPLGRRPSAALMTVIALGASTFVLASDAADQLVPSSPPAVQLAPEPAVDAADLPLGAMYHVVDQIGARELWSQGITGAGVNVALIDTGIAPVDGLLDPDKVVAAVDLSSEAGSPMTALVDTNGHGTHLAGIIAGRETSADPARSAEHPEWFIGVAPDAGIVSVKVGNRDGGVLPGALAAAVDWTVDNADRLGIRVLNLSVGSQASSVMPYRVDPLVAAVQRAWDAGLVVVTAAGNTGPDTDGLMAPANNPYVITVGGARVGDDGISAPDWASSGDGVRNPDLAAPGAHIQSLRAPGSDADVNHPTGYVDSETFQGSGSSQSAAVVSGAVALLLDARPELTNDQVKALLTASATPMADSPRLVGAGLLDVAAANTVAAPTVEQTWSRDHLAAERLTSADAEWMRAGATWWDAEWARAGATWWRAGATWWDAEWARAGATWWRAGATWWDAEWARAGATWWRAGATWWDAEWARAGATWWRAGATWWDAEWARAGATWWRAGATWWDAEWARAGATWWRAGATWWDAEWARAGATWWRAGATWWDAEWARAGATWWDAEWARAGATWWKAGATWW